MDRKLVLLDPRQRLNWNYGSVSRMHTATVEVYLKLIN